MKTNMEDRNKVNRRSAIYIVAIILIALGLIIIGLIHWMTDDDSELDRTANSSYRPKNKGAAAIDSTANAEAAPDDLAANNTKRKSDASLLASRAVAYKEIHNHQLPTGYSNGKLTGPSGSTDGINLAFYRNVSVVSGAHAPLTSDQLILVNNAACDDNAGTIEQSGSDLVVLYTQQTSQDHFASACLVT